MKLFNFRNVILYKVFFITYITTKSRNTNKELKLKSQDDNITLLKITRKKTLQ